MKEKASGYLANGIALAVLYGIVMALSAAGVLTNYYQGILILVMINIIMTVSLNMVSGFLGQLVLGHAGFMSVGAYTGALFTMYSGLPEWLGFSIGIILAGIVALVFGIIIGIPGPSVKRRLSGHHHAGFRGDHPRYHQLAGVYRRSQRTFRYSQHHQFQQCFSGNGFKRDHHDLFSSFPSRAGP